MTFSFERRPAVCDEHGEYMSLRVPSFRQQERWSGCPTCTAAEREAIQRAEADERRRRRAAAYLDDSGLVGRYRNATFDNFEAQTEQQRRALAACQAYAARSTPGWSSLWLLGPVGTGKSHLMAAIVNAYIGADSAAGWTTARGLIRRIRATWGREAEEAEAAVMAFYTRVPFLAIDELGIGCGTDSELTHLLDVVDARYADGLATAIATNLDARSLRAAVGDRIFDRLRENAIVVPCDWPSHRGRQPQFNTAAIGPEKEQA
jgi:DNA replication protein DnaC